MLQALYIHLSVHSSNACLMSINCRLTIYNLRIYIYNLRSSWLVTQTEKGLHTLLIDRSYRVNANISRTQWKNYAG